MLKYTPYAKKVFNKKQEQEFCKFPKHTIFCRNGIEILSK